MFGKKCSLCGGNLDVHKVCKECGLDNSKSEKYYKINRSSCDDMPLTHVHEKDSQQLPKRTKAASAKRKTEEDRKKGLLSAVTTLFVIISAAWGLFGNLIDSDNMEPDYSEEVIYNPYENLDVELPESGDTITYTLDSGEYVVGVHIAEGNYTAVVSGNDDVVQVTDHSNRIYMYESEMNGADNYLDDLRLFEGAVVTLTTKDGIQLETENGQSGTMMSLAENIVTDDYKLEYNNEAEAGLDFEPGIYDIYADSEFSYVNLTVYDEDGSEIDFRGYDLGNGGMHGNSVENVVIPKGAFIMCEEGGVLLTPSEMIWTTDYLEHYY